MEKKELRTLEGRLRQGKLIVFENESTGKEVIVTYKDTFKIEKNFEDHVFESKTFGSCLGYLHTLISDYKLTRNAIPIR